MKTVVRSRSPRRNQPLIETLESRQLLSGTLPTSTAAGSTVGPVRGELIHAVATQSFKAVVGFLPDIAATSAAPAHFTYEASINWGDGSVSNATFVHEALGRIDILGSHTYEFAGSDAIKITVLREPPPGTLGPVVLVGTIDSAASVIKPDGGVTLNEFKGAPFTAGLGLFSTSLSSSTLTAAVSWGDGTTSVGKIVAIPDTSVLAGGEFEVFGSHGYAATASYPVGVTVTAVPNTSAGSTVTAPIIILVAHMDSAIDVLPIPSTVVPVSPVAGTTTISSVAGSIGLLQ